MRTTFLAFALASLCALSYVACDPGTAGSTGPDAPFGLRKSTPYTLPISDTAGIQNAGALHNQGLAYIRANYNFGLNFTTTANQAAYILSLAGGYYRSHGGCDSAANDNPVMRRSLATMLDRRYPASDAEAWAAIRADARFAAIVPAAHAALIDGAVLELARPPEGAGRIQRANRLIAVADSLIAVWGALPRRGDGGEAVGGFLRIMRSSAAYWRDYPVSSAECGNVPPELGQLVQVDAIGYLYGWLMAVSQEIDANGRLDVANQYRRIGAGLTAAGSWSMGGLVRRYFGI
jgi:hypothetical protein